MAVAFKSKLEEVFYWKYRYTFLISDDFFASMSNFGTCVEAFVLFQHSVGECLLPRGLYERRTWEVEHRFTASAECIYPNAHNGRSNKPRRGRQYETNTRS